MPALSPGEIDAFLSEPGHLLRIGTIDSDGSPRVVPVWFIYEDRRVWFTPRARSAFLPNLRRDPRVGLSIDEDEHPYRKLTIQGTVVIAHETGDDDAWRDRYRRIALRYVPEVAADAYLSATHDEPRALCAVDLGISVTSTWRMPIAGEGPRGIWAGRYYSGDSGS